MATAATTLERERGAPRWEEIGLGEEAGGGARRWREGDGRGEAGEGAGEVRTAPAKGERPSISIDTKMATDAESDPEQPLFESPTELSDEDDKADGKGLEGMSIEIDRPPPAFRRYNNSEEDKEGEEEYEANRTIVPKMRGAMVSPPMSAPPTSYYRGGIDPPAPRPSFFSTRRRDSGTPATMTNSPPSSSGRVQNAPPASGRRAPRRPPPPPTNASQHRRPGHPNPNPIPAPHPTLTPHQLLAQLQATLQRDPSFFYTVKGVLAEYSERFGADEGWTFPPPPDPTPENAWRGGGGGVVKVRDFVDEGPTGTQVDSSWETSSASRTPHPLPLSPPSVWDIPILTPTYSFFASPPFSPL